MFQVMADRMIRIPLFKPAYDVCEMNVARTALVLFRLRPVPDPVIFSVMALNQQSGESPMGFPRFSYQSHRVNYFKSGQTMQEL